MNNAKERLQAVQAALVSRGVVDVKFFFNLGDDDRLTDVASDAASFLEAVVAGDYVEVAIDRQSQPLAA